MSRFELQNQNDFDTAQKQSEAFYATLKHVYCPYFEGTIAFNSNGYEHLVSKNRRRFRSRHDQYVRFKLLPYVPQIMNLSRTVQGIFHSQHFERTRVNSRTEIVLKPVSYYEFIAVLDGIRTKVLVKQIDNGELFFWSVIPFWKNSSKGNNHRKLHTGNPELD